MIDWSVPIRSSGWSGTGTVTVVCGSLLCITMWLPRRCTSTNPCRTRIAQTSLPESARSLPNGNFHSRDEHLLMEALTYLIS